MGGGFLPRVGFGGFLALALWLRPGCCMFGARLGGLHQAGGLRGLLGGLVPRALRRAGGGCCGGGGRVCPVAVLVVVVPVPPAAPLPGALLVMVVLLRLGHWVLLLRHWLGRPVRPLLWCMLLQLLLGFLWLWWGLGCQVCCSWRCVAWVGLGGRAWVWPRLFCGCLRVLWCGGGHDRFVGRGVGVSRGLGPCGCSLVVGVAELDPGVGLEVAIGPPWDAAELEGRGRVVNVERPQVWLQVVSIDVPLCARGHARWGV